MTTQGGVAACSFCLRDYRLTGPLAKAQDDTYICVKCAVASVRLLARADAGHNNVAASQIAREATTGILLHYKRFLYVNMLLWCGLTALPAALLAFLYANSAIFGIWYAGTLLAAIVSLFALSFFSIGHMTSLSRSESLGRAVACIVVVAVMLKIYSLSGAYDPFAPLMLCLWAELLAVIQGILAGLSMFAIIGRSRARELAEDETRVKTILALWAQSEAEDGSEIQ